MPIFPQDNQDVMFLTDSGVETTFIFHDKMALREFAAFEVLNDEKGLDHIKRYYRQHVELANHERKDAEKQNLGSRSSLAATSIGFVLESVTWRAHPDWIEKLGYRPEQLDEICEKAITVMKQIQQEYPMIPMITSGNIGPRYDGYSAEKLMSSEDAQDYHKHQIKGFKKAGADMVSALTLNSIGEGIGVVQAAQEEGIPVVLSFTLETDGRLITGESLREVIETVDSETNSGPAYYMINCAHVTHFIKVLESAAGKKERWIDRIGGIRANASKLSHAELDESEELDEGNPCEFGREYGKCLELLPNVNVFGGCCGTDSRHVREVRDVCLDKFQRLRGRHSVEQLEGKQGQDAS